MFITIKEQVTSELVEKKSKFIANMYYIETKEEAEQIIKDLKKKYFDARHNCSSYRVFENESVIEKANDDGEPSGTAGAPMLNILKKNNLCNVLVVVTRYFGGVLLGTGGLVRAYSDVTLEAIEKAEKMQICVGKEFEVSIDYSNLESLKYYCKKNDINIVKIEYLNQIICNIEMDNKFIPEFLEDIEQRNINILKYKEYSEKYIRKKVEEI